MIFRPGSRVVLTDTARSLFPDIGTRVGVVQLVDGWIVVRWAGSPYTTRSPATDLEEAP